LLPDESAFEDVEVDALGLGRAVGETQPEVDEAKLDW